MPTRPGDSWMNPVALRRVLELIEDALGRQLGVAELAHAAGLSTAAFLRAFRGATGRTPGDYLLGRRIARGADLLRGTKLPIASVARRSGFGSATYFATTFHQRTGLSPSGYRAGTRGPR